MEAKYHRQMLNKVLSTHFNQADLNTITRANLRQDWPRGQLHPEYHCDNSTFAASETYIHQQRQLTLQALAAQNRAAALAAFGRLLHTRQDFYAHSNWIPLQVAQHGGLTICAPESVALCLNPLVETNLISGNASIPRWLLYRIPLLGSFVKRFYFPPDSHEAMNLDNPKQGPLFAYAMAAATRHTQLEFEQLLAEVEENLGKTSVASFLSPSQ
ncbi:MAG: hypothetical protein IAF02_07395 [Anaerolineae bacterium]|nr:hypothetical protein [Anaerolineae bacterium]